MTPAAGSDAPATVVLLDDLLAAAPGQARSRRYLQPVGTADCRRREDLPGFFEAIETWRRAGLWVLLLLDYEFGNLLDAGASTPTPAAGARDNTAQALAFETMIAGTRQDVDEWIERELQAREALTAPAGIAALQGSIERDAYERRFDQVQRFIRDGDTYQINLTFPLHFQWYGEALALYRQLRQRQKVSYAAFIELTDRTIVSLSPELFFWRRGGQLQTRPMKGTSPRGANFEQDRAIAERMRADPKSRAENLMIVDLLRNDLGRVCEIGSVQVRSLFDVETFETLLQMTSTVQGRLRADVSLEAILRALFPCGSVTGAPKHRSRQIIAQVEQRARGIYTGSIGYLDPDGTLALNVAIRTLELERDGRGRLGIGGGVVADSTAPGEWNECFIKARFLTGADPGFELIETMRAEVSDRGGKTPLSERIVLWERHRERLQRSAAHFAFHFEPDQLLAAVDGALDSLPSGSWRVRMTLDKSGHVDVRTEALTLPAAAAVPAVAISRATVRSDAWHQAHKTTFRPQYNPELQSALSGALWDVLFFNERDELVEGARTSVFVRLDGTLCTPPLQSGALPGVMRAHVLADRSSGAVERTILRRDLQRAQEVYLCNAVRGLFRVKLIG
ncbi:MAG: aminodeoxychorismate synthase component I [Burkholderiaceae bacterium]|nr:aminodeoxychorismate synthase component I [Burkholderiaceae bacterium]